MVSTSLWYSRHKFSRSYPRTCGPLLSLVGLICLTLLLLIPMESVAQWSARPGDTVRDVFGPSKSLKAPMCRGACGSDCPSSCKQDVEFECAGNGRLLQVRVYACGTHQACRQHDDCLDRCIQTKEPGYDCETECHAEAVEDWGVENAAMWAAGDGPMDADHIRFEYTMDRNDGAQALYRCPQGSRQECGSDGGRCVDSGQIREPVFVTFFGGAPGVAQVSNFRSGSLCIEAGSPSGVCEPTVDIEISGRESCPRSGGAAPCTWYGFELDYQNGNPTAPLICRTSAAKEDFLGGMLSKAIESAPPKQEDATTDTGEQGLGDLLGAFQEQLQQGRSLDQIFSGVTITTEDGETLGPPPESEVFPEPGVPGELALSGSTGHLFVPIFEWYDASPPGTTVEHQIKCLQEGRPVLQTKFRLNFVSQ